MITQLLIVLALLVGGYFLYTYSKSKSGSLDSYSEINELVLLWWCCGEQLPAFSSAGENGDHAPVAGVSTAWSPPSCVKQNDNPRVITRC